MTRLFQKNAQSGRPARRRAGGVPTKRRRCGRGCEIGNREKGDQRRMSFFFARRTLYELRRSGKMDGDNR